MRIRSTYFGMHDGRLRAGSFPDAPVGSVRLWDSGTNWRQLELSAGQFAWGDLDTAVRTAESHGARVLLVLGQTPTFHASRPAEEAPYGLGAASMPDLAAWRRYVAAVVDRYGDRNDYQIWNEPNVTGFWTGTPAQMARLTVEAASVIRRGAPGSTVVAPSFPLRLSGQRAWFRDYWDERVGGRPMGDVVDVVAVHLYPEASGTPEDGMVLLRRARRVLAARDVDLPIWNTEINYGLLGGEVPPPISDDLQRSFVLRTYLLNAAAGVERVYWYRWDLGPIANTLMTEPDLSTPTAAGRAYTTAHDWLARTRVRGCGPMEQESRPRVIECMAEVGDGTVRRFYWTVRGESQVTTPPATTSWTAADGSVHERRGAYELPVGVAPVMVEGRS